MFAHVKIKSCFIVPLLYTNQIASNVVQNKQELVVRNLGISAQFLIQMLLCSVMSVSELLFYFFYFLIKNGIWFPMQVASFHQMQQIQLRVKRAISGKLCRVLQKQQSFPQLRFLSVFLFNFVLVLLMLTFGLHRRLLPELPSYWKDANRQWISFSLQKENWNFPDGCFALS